MIYASGRPRLLYLIFFVGAFTSGVGGVTGCDSGVLDEPPEDPHVPITVTWESLQGPLGGSVVASISTPVETLVAAVGGEGVYWRAHGDQRWQHGEGLPLRTMYGLAKDAPGRLFTSFGEHVYVSENEGRTWQETALHTPIVTLTAGPGNTIYALTFEDGVQWTDDGGVTWQVISTQLNAQQTLTDLLVQAFVVDAEGNVFAGTLEGGVMRYLAGAATWEQSGLADVPVNVLASSPDGMLYAGSHFTPGLYRSQDVGVTWERLDDRLPITDPERAVINALATDDQGTVYAAVQGNLLFRSQDKGTTWQQLPWIAPPVIFSMTTNGDRDLLVSTLEGLWLLQPSEPVAQQVGVSLSGVSAVMSNKGEILAGSLSGFGGVYHWKQDEPRWIRQSLGGRITAWAQAPNGRLFVGTTVGPENADGNVYISDNAGISWTPTALPSAAVKALVILETGEILAGVIGSMFSLTPEGGVYRSSDNGQTWTHEGLETDIYALTILPDGILLAGGVTEQDEGRIFRSTDGGRSWNRREIDELAPIVQTLAVDSRGYAYAGTQEQGIYRSTDGGRSWKQVAPILTDVPVHDLLATSDGSVYAATDAGLYTSSNGVDWDRTGTNLGGVVILSLVFGDDGYLYAGTDRLGVLRGQPFRSGNVRVVSN